MGEKYNVKIITSGMTTEEIQAFPPEEMLGIGPKHIFASRAIALEKAKYILIHVGNIYELVVSEVLEEAGAGRNILISKNKDTGEITYTEGAWEENSQPK